MIKKLILFFITTFLLVIGQALWKIASGQLSGVSESGLLNFIIRLLTNLPFLVGCCLYVIATGLWIYLLGQYEYSKIYPIFVGACIILSLFVGILFFKENTGLNFKIIGSGFIIFGIIIISKS